MLCILIKNIIISNLIFNNKFKKNEIETMNTIKIDYSFSQGINTNEKLVKTNYLNYSDEWSRNRLKELGYYQNKK